MLSDLFFQALFASCIPEIIDLIGTRPKYGGAYKNERGRRQEDFSKLFALYSPWGKAYKVSRHAGPHTVTMQVYLVN